MPRGGAAMASLQISPTIDYDNDVQIALADYPGIKVPKGVSAREPELVSFARMSKLAPDKFPAPAGLTVPTDMTVKLDGTWKSSGSTPPQWQFLNGTLQLSVTIAVYVIENYRPVKKLFELIMTHEFMHVLDEIEVATDYLPTELPKDEYVKKYLIDGSPVADATYRNWF